MAASSNIQSAEDLITPYSETRAGFLRIVLEKNRQATPFVEDARVLKAMASRVSSPDQLLEMDEIRPALLYAAGMSFKAQGHIADDVKDGAVEEFVQNFLEPVGDDFVDELVFRFLLTKGDSLGGKMRNIAGKVAEQQMLQSIISTLSIRGKEFRWHSRQAKKWIRGNREDPSIAQLARGLTWSTDGIERTLWLNLGVLGVEKNVDLCLINASPAEIKPGKKKPSAHHDHSKYLALGELKGGIDPAGADEHWKTAVSALNRIKGPFAEKGLDPSLFFVGAAIERAMASELFSQLSSGDLAYAANLTSDTQMSDLCNWLVTL